MRSAPPDPDMATWYPAAIAARAMVVPTRPAPTMPRRPSPVSPLDMDLRRHRFGGITGRNLGYRMMGQQLAHPRNYLPPVKLDPRHPLLERHSSRGPGH